MYSSSNHVYFPKLDLSLLAKRPTRDSDTKFPCKLHKMLKDVEDEGFTHIISWHNDGKCFRVHEPEEFVEKILLVTSKSANTEAFNADGGVVKESSRNSPTKPKDTDGFRMNSRHKNRKNVGMFPSPLFETQDTQTETPIVEDEESVKQLLYDSTYSEQALTRRNSYQDLCESIMGSDCEACKDGARLMNEIMEIDNFGFAI
ncbi:HSF-type DNA-binding protein [Nitzschia inconspicua]|uniref:HSF-type DNA-binding protein n=1 Tax=Nitzschia inconspicua TaxID=303405 RepID=A0A9K3P8Z0_9STRA|nr:HSF-type DNA-binding protein [Nitzschia inconspicua]